MLKRAVAATALILAAATAAPASDQAISVVAFDSVARPFADTLVLRGRTEADRRVDVRSEIAGLIASEPLRKGALVEKGDVLCQIAEGDRVAEMAEARAFLREAEVNAEAAEQLVQKGFTSETTKNTRMAALEASRARVLRAEINMARLTIRAPFSGILESDTAELGSLLQNGSTCASLIALDPIKLVAFAPERSVDELAVGAEVAANLITGREVTGMISFVARSADRDTRTYLVEAETPNPDLSIRDGMTAEIDVSLTARDAHLAPQNALTLNDAGALGVRVVENGVAKFYPVEILKDVNIGAWIAGLPEQAQIIVVGQEFVTDGQTVEVELIDPARLQ
ncbi:MAG: efflux RND transporter periplasmic adaptor subunit [Pseudomonadota bacterium]